MSNEKMASPSLGEAHRIANLGLYFRAYLQNWFEGLAEGMELTPGVERELSLALIEFACLTRLSKDSLGTDDQNSEHIERVSKELLEHLEREMRS